MRTLLTALAIVVILIGCKKEKEQEPVNPVVPNSLKDGLVAYFPFSGTPDDISGNNNHGTIFGNVIPTSDRKGRINSAYLFDGNSGTYINVPMSNTLKIKNQISISVWIYMDGGFYNPRVISNEWYGADMYMMAVATTSNVSRNLEASFGTATAGAGFCCGGINGIEVSALGWRHIVFSVGPNSVANIYLDGKLIKTAQGSDFSASNYGPNLNIGRNSYPAYDSWGGKIDELRIYNRPLSQTEVTYLSAN